MVDRKTGSVIFSKKEKREYLDEAAVLLFTDGLQKKKVIRISLKTELSGLQGAHSVVEGGKYLLDYNAFMVKLKTFDAHIVPHFQEYTALKKSMVAAFKEELRLDDFKSNVLTSFVRNKLIDQVYLPLIGANLAKQIGTVGANKRTDRMGMLLLISPPGMGKLP